MEGGIEKVSPRELEMAAVSSLSSRELHLRRHCSCLHASSGSAALPKRRRALSLVAASNTLTKVETVVGSSLQPPPRKPSLATISIIEKKHGIRKEDAINNILEVTPTYHRGLHRAPSP
uniref:Uncharacterized protein n=1 Tax=Oryza glumipatula TaxID=40148 RepID=A0A0D9ZVK6_9ORYZ